MSGREPFGETASFTGGKSTRKENIRNKNIHLNKFFWRRGKFAWTFRKSSRELSEKVPKGPFRTKNAMALKIVVKYYRSSILLSLPIRCHLSQEKKHPNYYRGSELLSR